MSSRGVESKLSSKSMNLKQLKIDFLSSKKCSNNLLDIIQYFKVSKQLPFDFSYLFILRL